MIEESLFIPALTYLIGIRLNKQERCEIEQQVGVLGGKGDQGQGH